MSGATNDENAYDLGTSFPIAEARAQRPGTTLLVTGPRAVAERAAFEFLLAGTGADEGIVPVSIDRAADDLREALSERAATPLTDRLGVVDVTGEHAGVESAADLAAIGRELNENIEALDTRRVRVGVLSLTGMLEQLDRTEVFKFCHVIRDRIGDAGFLGVATLDTGAVDEATVSMLQEAFDATVEVDEDEKGDIVRVVGLPDAPVTWHDWS